MFKDPEYESIGSSVQFGRKLRQAVCEKFESARDRSRPVEGKLRLSALSREVKASNRKKLILASIISEACVLGRQLRNCRPVQ
jgi:hypothetical protein